jgi:hypothetical protein
MRLVLVMLLLAAGCVDTVKCHTPVAWQPCMGETSEPGASGTPPTITGLMLPTCADQALPSVAGTIAINDLDGDAELIKTSFYVGVRLSETDTMIPIGHMGQDYSAPFSVVVPMAKVGSYDVRVKAVDRAGGQSAPVCNTVTILQ